MGFLLCSNPSTYTNVRLPRAGYRMRESTGVNPARQAPGSDSPLSHAEIEHA